MEEEEGSEHLASGYVPLDEGSIHARHNELGFSQVTLCQLSDRPFVRSFCPPGSQRARAPGGAGRLSPAWGARGLSQARPWGGRAHLTAARGRPALPRRGG